MQTIATTELSPVPRARTPICDASTGDILIDRGQPVTEDDLAELLRLGIDRVTVLAPGEDAQVAARNAQFTPLDRADLRPGMTIAFDIYDDTGKVLLAKGTLLKENLLSRLARRRVHKIFVRRTPDPRHVQRARQAQASLQRLRAGRRPPRPKFGAEEFVGDPRLLTSSGVERLARALEASGGMQARLPTDATALLRFVRFVEAHHRRDNKTKEYYLRLYQELIDQARRIYQALADRAPVNGRMVMNMVEETVHALVEDHPLLLCTLYIPCADDVDYLPHHAVNVSILAVNIATAAGFSNKQVHEVGYGALLADVGMLSVPPGIRFKQEKLSSDEHLEIMRHTLYGIDRLQQVHHLPRSAPLVGYQSHERLDGSGYPHNKRVHGIHDYAKIVAIADIFAAQTARRPFRPRGRLPYAAVEEVLRMTGGGKLARRFVRAMLQAISLFPVGSWVRLNTGDAARVVAANHRLYTRPVVNVLYDAMGRPCQARRIDLSRQSEVQVVAPIAVRAQDPLAGF